MSSRALRWYYLTLILLAAVSLWLYSRENRASAQGLSVFSGYPLQSPGQMHHIPLRDLPQPYATPSADEPARVISRPANAWPNAPKGFSVQLYARGLENPRLLRAAPNGDVFLAESQPGIIKVLRGIDNQGRVREIEDFATGLDKPFGIAFYPLGPEPQWVYVAIPIR